MVRPRVEDVGTATLPDHAFLEARVNTHLEGRRVKGKEVRLPLPTNSPKGKEKQVSVLHLHPSFHWLHTHTHTLQF